MSETNDSRRARKAAQSEALSEVRALLEEQRAVRAELRRARQDAVAAARHQTRRAPAMNVEDRRAAIIAVAIPLLIEHGAAVTTSQVATAAGIAEGTVFRAFKDKRELLLACMRAVMDSEEEIDRIAAIDQQLSLEQRLTTAVGYIADFQARAWSVMQAIHASGVRADRESFGDEKEEPGKPPRWFVKVIEAIAELFESDAGQLAIAPALAAQLLLGLTFTNHMQGKDEAVTDVPQLVHLFLHGVLHTPDGGRSTE